MTEEEIKQTVAEIKERQQKCRQFLDEDEAYYCLQDRVQLLSIVESLSNKLAEQVKNFCPDRTEIRRRLIEEIGIFNEDNPEAVEYAVLVVIEYCERYGKEKGK